MLSHIKYHHRCEKGGSCLTPIDVRKEGGVLLDGIAILRITSNAYSSPLSVMPLKSQFNVFEKVILVAMRLDGTVKAAQ